jgi:protein-tyrosine phosphatase
MNVKLLVNCLDNHEMNLLGNTFEEYERLASEFSFEVLRIPMVEGSTPIGFEVMETLLDQILAVTGQAEMNGVLCHCRGGMGKSLLYSHTQGRAGLVACCFLIHTGKVSTARDAIRIVREFRSPKAIETRRQEDYIAEYVKHREQRRGVIDSKIDLCVLYTYFFSIASSILCSLRSILSIVFTSVSRDV